jgi:hypothetical protein
MLPADSRFVRIVPSARPVLPGRWMRQHIESIIRQHSGPLRVLAAGAYDHALLAAYGVSLNRADCLAVHTYADNFAVCSAYRTSDGPSSAVALKRPGPSAQVASPASPTKF